MRPFRCSSRFGFQGISKWIIREQWFWRSMPSEAASVASRMRTGLCFGIGLERRLDPLPVLRVHAAVHRQQAVVAGETLGGQDALQPVLGGPVLGEDDDPLVGPLPARAGCVSLSQRISRLGLGVELARWPVPPTPSSP